MLREIAHIGITISNLEKSISFYRDILQLEYLGSMVMQGKETDLLFATKNCIVKVAYLNGSKELFSPPIELLEFISPIASTNTPALTKQSISEICFRVEDIEKSYQKLRKKGVEFLSKPQCFDFSKNGFGKSKAVYFKDPDGIILELIQSY